ncbi:hypothetical protein Q9233_012198 [Columba guinea]|nr:hypothetical protein Q9233_012198 [Columba guinea]
MSSPSVKKYLWQKSLELVNQTGKSKWPDYQGPRSTIHRSKSETKKYPWRTHPSPVVRYKIQPADEEALGLLTTRLIHHFSTEERYMQAIKEMAGILRVGGQIMIYVWAMEQNQRRFEKQDVFVPWNPSPPSCSSDRIRGERPTPTPYLRTELEINSKGVRTEVVMGAQHLC